MSTMVLDGTTPRARSTDPTTSVDAGRSANLFGSQAFVHLLLQSTPAGLAQYELEEFGAGSWTPQRIRSAVAELREKGYVEDSGKRRLTPYDRNAIVWCLTSEGRARR